VRILSKYRERPKTTHPDPPSEAKGSVLQKHRGLVASLCVVAATYAPRASSPREDAIYASHDVTITCEAGGVHRVFRRPSTAGIGEAAHVLTGWLPGKAALEEATGAPVQAADRVGAFKGPV